VGWTSDHGGTLHGFCLDLPNGAVPHLGGEVESLAASVNEARLEVAEAAAVGALDHRILVDWAKGVADGAGGDVRAAGGPTVRAQARPPVERRDR
jgi:hypothetical protein